MKNYRYEGGADNKLAGLLFPDIKKDIKYWFDKYPNRAVPAYRIAPSPTGYVHIGTIAMALVNSFLARSGGGVFYMRLEDTDDKRLVADAADNMRKTFDLFGIKFDEGAFIGGPYAPYIQSQRTEIYHTFAKYLVGRGAAYPCFCTENELNEIREKQQKNKEKTGYYGKYARCKNLSFDEVKRKIEKGERWVLRADFSKWRENERISWIDAVRGEMSLPAEINDPVILKSNGIPPYNFAHIVDDLLMGTTTVIRGEEWLVSTAQHLQLAALLGGPEYRYAHLPTICINDSGSKRKLSKRKDKMALAMNLIAEGYPAAAVIEYLLTLYNTDFELWRTAEPNADLRQFPFKIEKIGTNNPLFDIPKLADISKNVLAKLSCMEIVAEFNKYYKLYRPFELNADEKERAEKMLCVERETVRPRKDLIKYGDIPILYDYVFARFAVDRERTESEQRVLDDYAAQFSSADDKTVWFEKIKTMAVKHNFAPDKNEYKAHPEKYKGTIADFVQIIRTAVTGRDAAPDLWAVCQILGEKIIKKRCAGAFRK